MGIDMRAMKIAAAAEALLEVESGMTLGLGTGSTSEEFVKLLGASISRGELRGIRGVCTSRATEALARSLGIATLTLDEAQRLDLAIDGADEIDPQLRLIKGHGGALLREKIVEQSADRFLVVADQSKVVERLGRRALPVEVVRFATAILQTRFERRGLDPRPRRSGDALLVTDEGNHILDVRVPESDDIAVLVMELKKFAGVVETGFFPDEADEAIIAGESGVTRLTRTR